MSLNASFARSFGMIGLLGALVSGLLPSDPAYAQDDDDGRRRLSARHMDQTDALSEEYEAAAMTKRLESIEFLKGLLAKGTAEGDTKAEMMLRLADLYYQQGRALYLREMKKYDGDFEACFNTEGCNAELLKPDNHESTEWQDKAIRLYDQILTSYPRYDRADEALYYQGAALSDTGRREDGVEKFTKLVKLYPDSQFVPDAYVLIGEYYFDENNAYKALLAYKKATAYRDSPKYGFATYKLAWCYYNVGEYGKAIDTMKAVVAYSMSQTEDERKKSGSLALEDEALKDLVRFFADAGALEEAYEYFGKLGRQELIRSMLKRLAATYFEQGKWEECIATYRRLIAEDPQSADNPDYQHEIVQAYQKIGDKDAHFEEVQRMIKTYGKTSAWFRANASDPEAQRKALDYIERDLISLATYHHDRARKLYGTEAEASYDLAGKAYTIYLEEFPDGSHAYDVHYQYAELLYKLKRFDEAYTQYMAVVTADPNGKHSRFCAESAIFAADEMVKAEQASSSGSGETDNKVEVPLTDWDKRLIDACDQYARLYPDDEKVRNIIYKSAYLLYHKHHYAEAATRFKQVIAMEPASSEAEKAAHLILDSFRLVEDWTHLKENAKFYYEQPGLGSKKFKSEVYEIYQKASLKMIEVDFDQRKDYGATADAYMEFYKEFPDSTELPRVLNNSALYYREAHRMADAMAVRHILIEDPRFGDKTKYYYDQIGALGFDYENVADFGQAASMYEKLFSLYPDRRKALIKENGGADAEPVKKLDQDAADAIYSAALFRKALGDSTTAITDYSQFLASFGTDARANDVRLAIARIHEDQQDWVKAGNDYYGFYTTATATTPAEMVYFARLHYGLALEKQGQGPKATKIYEETVKGYDMKSTPGPQTEFVAEMMYKLAEPRYAAYDALEIKGCGCRSQKKEDDAIAAALTKKATALKEMEGKYGDIIKTGAGEWGLAALVKLGQAYEEMGAALKGSEIPYYLTEDQAEIYRMRLEDSVYPQIEKAVAAYSTALSKSYELTLYNDNTAFATRRLGVLRPEEFPGLEEKLFEPGWTTRPAHHYSFETEL